MGIERLLRQGGRSKRCSLPVQCLPRSQLRSSPTVAVPGKCRDARLWYVADDGSIDLGQNGRLVRDKPTAYGRATLKGYAGPV